MMADIDASVNAALSEVKAWPDGDANFGKAEDQR
jgi:hypothetical protein